MNDRPNSAEIVESEAEELREFATVIAYGCCAWWALAGVLSLYWASGGTVGVWTLWAGSEHLSGSRESWLVSLLWTIGTVQIALVPLALAIARRWRRGGLPVVVNTSAFLIGLTLVPFVAVDTLVGGLVSIGVLEGAIVDLIEVGWRFVFWNPWWVIGVLLYCGGAWLAQYATDEATDPSQSSSKG